MTGSPTVCVSRGGVFEGPPHHVRCGRCWGAWRRIRDHEAGFRLGWEAAVERVGVAVDHHALAQALADLHRTGGEA